MYNPGPIQTSHNTHTQLQGGKEKGSFNPSQIRTISRDSNASSPAHGPFLSDSLALSNKNRFLLPSKLQKWVTISVDFLYFFKNGSFWVRLVRSAVLHGNGGILAR